MRSHRMFGYGVIYLCLGYLSGETIGSTCLFYATSCVEWILWELCLQASCSPHATQNSKAQIEYGPPGLGG